MSHVLIVDDEPSICWAFRESLTGQGHQVSVAASAEEAIELTDREAPDVVVLDVRLPGMDGLTAIRQLRSRIGDAPIIVITAFGSLDTAVRAIDQGAFDYLPKPFDLDQAVTVIKRALASPARPAETNGERPTADQDTIVGKSPAMQAVFKKIALVADSDAPVLITGESGTGKELAAHAIHRHSRRGAGPFVPVCVAALSPTIVESELFGYVKGAFTGADVDRVGLLDLANGGTVLFDEIGDVPAAQQVKLLRAIERGELTPVGGARGHRADFRVVAATNRDLPELIRTGEFREDLFYRLGVFHIELPPLRERRDDIPELAAFFLAQIGGAHSRSFTDEAIDELCSRAWNGNVRELRNAVEHAAIVARGERIGAECLPAPALPLSAEPETPAGELLRIASAWSNAKTAAAAEEGDEGQLYEELLSVVEPALLEAALKQSNGNLAAAARLLGMHRATLRQKLKKWGSKGE